MPLSKMLIHQNNKSCIENIINQVIYSSQIFDSWYTSTNNWKLYNSNKIQYIISNNNRNSNYLKDIWEPRCTQSNPRSTQFLSQLSEATQHLRYLRTDLITSNESRLQENSEICSEIGEGKGHTPMRRNGETQLNWTQCRFR